MKGPIQDFVDDVVILENAILDFCAGVIGVFARSKPMLNPSVNGKKEISGKEFVEDNSIAVAFSCFG